jgi:hypothetical protein
MVSSISDVRRHSVYDDSDSFLRSSLKGLFTGKNKENKLHNMTIHESTNSTQESNEYSNLVTNTDTAFSGNPIKTLRHKKKNVFSSYLGTDAIEARGIEDLLNDFNSNTNDFKQSMKSLDVAQKLKQNRQSYKLSD